MKDKVEGAACGRGSRRGGLLRTRRNSARHIAFEGVAAGDHGEAILELDEAAIHRAAGEDEAALAFATVAVPAEDRLPRSNMTGSTS